MRRVGRERNPWVGKRSAPSERLPKRFSTAAPGLSGESGRAVCAKKLQVSHPGTVRPLVSKPIARFLDRVTRLRRVSGGPVVGSAQQPRTFLGLAAPGQRPGIGQPVPDRGVVIRAGYEYATLRIRLYGHRRMAYCGAGAFSNSPIRCPGLMPFPANHPRFISSAKRAGATAQ